MTDPARMSFTRPAWAALAVLGLLLLGLLATQIALLEDQRTTVDRQLAVAVRQLETVEPVADDARPYLRESRAALPAGRRLVREATPLVQELRNARASEQLQAAGALARTLLEADIGTTTRQIDRADLPRLSARLTDTLDDLGRSRAIAKGAEAAETVPRIEAVLRRSLAVQRQTLVEAYETRQLVVALRDLGIETRDLTRDAAEAAKSLDRKTGPSLATASGG